MLLAIGLSVSVLSALGIHSRHPGFYFSLFYIKLLFHILKFPLLFP